MHARQILRYSVLGTLLLAAAVSRLQAEGPQREAPLPEQVEFNRDIRPLLSDRCFRCHGPDKNQRQAELRLDRREAVFAPRDGAPVVIAGEPDKSELVRRVLSADPHVTMPPPDSGSTLSPRERKLIRRWVAQGAKWQQHWSLIPPRRPSLPQPENRHSAVNPIDLFIRARLEQAGLKPSPPADKQTLLRRVTLDLTGLPPTPDEVDRFLADDSASAYEKAVDRLLASPHYGERMAALWLDAARYADTSGYQTDGEREMWRWRDWVIDAYNRNLPFDRFTIEQLAGDLLPDATLPSRIASGFNRNHRMNSEGGIVPEEFLLEYAIDRLDTTCTVWLGLTMGCARCHEHKYDPIPQADFYRMLSYFNNVEERGRVIKYGNERPFIPTPTAVQQAQQQQIAAQHQAACEAFAQLQPKLRQSQTAWEAALTDRERTSLPAGKFPSEDLAHCFPLDGQLVPHSTATHAASAKENDGQKNTAGKKASAPAAPYRFVKGKPRFAGGVFSQAAVLRDGSSLELGAVEPLTGADRFSFSLWFKSDAPQTAALVSLMSDDDSRDKGLAIRLENGSLVFNFGQRWLDDAIRVAARASLEHGRWHHLAVSYDGTQRASGVQIYLNAKPLEQRVLLDFFTGTVTVEKPLRIGSQGGKETFSGSVDEVRLYHASLTAEQVQILSSRHTVRQILTLPEQQRSAADREKLAFYYLQRFAPAEIQSATERCRQRARQLASLKDRIPTTMVMQERSRPQATYLLDRGEYDKPLEEVQRGTPECLPPLPEDAPNNRLGLAMWLVDPNHPLTARVAVNRMWQMHFGTGLVATPEDFGSQGAWPSHPELLDWLAREFIARGWDVKSMHRLIVTSATYRQSSHVRPEHLASDPANELLARMRRLRLSAEVVRDQALAASGLLVRELGGRSARTYQPAGLWAEIASAAYHQDHGRNLYRRSLYTFWKRTVPPPLMSTFDAPSREACILQRSRTNTPLQALALMNEVTFVEAARKLAERAMRETGDDQNAQLARIFLLITGRRPRPEESAILHRHFARQLSRFTADRQAAVAMLSAGESPRDETLAVAPLAALTATANLIMNLDEVVMRE